MAATTGITGAIGSGIWCISTDGLPYSAFQSEEIAADYLKDLKLCKPHEDWELEKLPMEAGWHIGRQDGEDKAIWGSLSCWDFGQRKLIQFRRKWFFDGLLSTIPRPVSGDTLPRFLWLYHKSTEEGKVESACRHLKKLTYQIIPGEPENAKF